MQSTSTSVAASRNLSTRIGAAARRRFDGVGHVVVELLFVARRSPSRGRRARSWGGRGRDSRSSRAILRASSTLRAMPLSGCFRSELLEQVAELLAIAGGVEGIDGGAEDGDAGFLETAREVQRGLSAELDDDAFDQTRGLASVGVGRLNGPPFSRSQMLRMSSCVSGSKKSRSLVS